MSRPLKTGVNYYPHDVDMSIDHKILALEAQFGLEGYAFYCKMLEQVYAAGGELDFGKSFMADSICTRLNIRKKKFESLLKCALNCELFDRNRFETENKITSAAIAIRFQRIARERARKRGAENQEDTPIMDGNNSGSSAPKQNKAKETEIEIENKEQGIESNNSNTNPEEPVVVGPLLSKPLKSNPDKSKTLLVDSLPISISFWEKMLTHAENEQEAALWLYRAKYSAKEKLCGWVIAGIRSGYIRQEIREEKFSLMDDCQKWIDDFLEQVHGTAK